MRREALGPACAKATAGEVNSNRNRNDKIALIMLVRIIVALLVAVGIAFSIRDYKSWRSEETKNFGQGPGSASFKLNQVYQNDEWGIRMKYPEGWDIEQTVKFERTEKNLPDIVDEEIAKIGNLDREPDHPETNITVLTRGGRQMAITKGGMVVVRIEGPDGGVVGEMAKSLAFF